MSVSAFSPIRRATLWIPGTGPASDPERAHLFVILTDPCEDGLVCIVPICTAGDKYDHACILGKGDHPFLRHKSYAAYFRLNTFAADALIEQERRGSIEFRGMIDEKVFALICAGVAKSNESPPRFKKYFEERTIKNVP